MSFTTLRSNTSATLFSMFFTLLLTACGGGGGSDKSNSPGSNASSSSYVSSSDASSSSSSLANTAPTLNGALNLNAKAELTSTWIFNINDEENDPVQISIANKPDWLTYELVDSQLTLFATPGFFDISENAIALTISDGNSSASYGLQINVTDNPEKWQITPVTATKIVGQWGLDDGSRLYLYPNGEGSYIDKENKISLLYWNEDSNNFNISAKRPSCATDCELNFSLAIVAEQDGKLRLAINDRLILANAQRFVFSSLADGNYVIPNGRWSSFNKISHNGTIVESLPDVETGNFSGYTFILPKFKASIDKINVYDAELLITQSSPDYYTRTSWFTPVDGSAMQAIAITTVYDSIRVLASAANDLIINLVVRPNLAGESANINPDNYLGLREFLNQTAHIYYETIAAGYPIQPTINAGDKFYFPFAPARWDFVTYASSESYSSNSLIVFETETSGYLSLNMPLFLQEKKNAFTWELKDNKLKLTFASGQPPIEYTFSTNPEGGIDAYTHASYYEIHGPVIKFDATPTPLDPTLGYYFGRVPGLRPGAEVYNFIYTSASDYTGTPMQFSYSLEISEPYSSFWQQEEDGSITFLNRTNCPSLTFEDCRLYLQTHIDTNTPDTRLQYVNYKPLTSNNNIYTLLQTNYYNTINGSGENEESISQWLVELTADLDNYQRD